jgi:hypothetical protein
MNDRHEFETRSLPALARGYPRRFTFYVADPISSIETRSLPALARGYPRALPSMSLIPSAPLKLASVPCLLAATRRRFTLYS